MLRLLESDAFRIGLGCISSATCKGLPILSPLQIQRTMRTTDPFLNPHLNSCVCYFGAPKPPPAPKPPKIEPVHLPPPPPVVFPPMPEPPAPPGPTKMEKRQFRLQKDQLELQKQTSAAQTAQTAEIINRPLPPPPPPVAPPPSTSSLETQEAAAEQRRQQSKRQGLTRSLIAGETGGYKSSATPPGSLLGGGR